MTRFWAIFIAIFLCPLAASSTGVKHVRIPVSAKENLLVNNSYEWRPIPILTLFRTTLPPVTGKTEPPPQNENPAVTRFRQYLRFDTSHPNPNYEPCIEWLKSQAAEIGLDYKKVDFPAPGLFAIIMKWEGSNTSLQSIVLDSHIDVVPADKSKWKYDPFAAIKESNGDIYARGAQDRKSLGAQYLEAIRNLKSKGFKPLRTLYITYLPDEEVGGGKGMQPFVKSTIFKSMNIGMVLDEGGATTGDDYAVYYGERSAWQFKMIATGQPSHAAYMFKDNSAVKLAKVIDRLLKFRQEQLEILERNPALEAGDVTSINLSQLGGGLQPNIVPSEMWAIFDMRIRIKEPNWTFANVTAMLDAICAEAGPGVRYEFILKSEMHGETKLEESNIWWTAFRDIFVARNLTLVPKIFPGATDARYVRNANIPALGFCPLPRTSPLQHQDNEFLSETTFLNGIDMYEVIIKTLTTIP